jgi:hypothetical protein
VEHFALAAPATANPLLEHFSRVALELNVVLPISFFEAAGNVYFNTVAIIDSDGEILGFYRKSHIPGPPISNWFRQMLCKIVHLPIDQMVQGTQKSSTSAQETPVSRFGKQKNAALELAFAGISGILSALGAWPSLAQK